MFTSSTHRDERLGLYREEIGKLVDGLVEELRSGRGPVERWRAVARLHKACHLSSYARDESLAVETLALATHACAAITGGILTDSGGAGIRHFKPSSTEPFPWHVFAGAALAADATVELRGRFEYLALHQ